MIRVICSILDELFPDSCYKPHASLVTFVRDRAGHDRRYAIDSSKMERELGWQAQETFESGIRKTVRWYLEHPAWVESVQTGAYRDWLREHYGEQDSKTALRPES